MNKLRQETSPYLLQHADNPVDWHPWGEEALSLARAQDKPILLSIGYSACHWCHVMAHESFEDPDVAAVMNRLFVNIKVDREERPDLDQIYQTAHQMLSQRAGGWPLTVFLTPDQVPFFAGTYFPRSPRYKLPGFAQLCGQIEEAYRTQREDIERQNASLLEAFGRIARAGQGAPDAGSPDGGPIKGALAALMESFDPRHGGFGRAPKFPHPSELALCLRAAALDDDPEARHAVLHTLTCMAEGGVFDQLGGGFCRYSTDERWLIPHFEKMLYDNGPLLALYADAWLLDPQPLYARVAEQTAGWVMREMQSPDGGYWSSLDADSEGEEGRFYVWTPDEARAVLDAREYALASAHWGLDGPANFEGHHWNLHVARPLGEVAGQQGLSHEDASALLESARAKLFAARAGRVRPGLDDKVLTSWNALMISGMARAGCVFGREDWIASAARALDFIRATLWVRGEDGQGRLLATCKDGRAHLNAYLDDHAFLLSACLGLLQARFDAGVLGFACELADALLARFPDAEHGGFYFTSDDHERLIQRPKPGHDNATPSGNGVAALALNRLAILTGEQRYAAATAATVAAFLPAMREQPGGFASLCMALAEQLVPPRTVILRGPADGLPAWQLALAARTRPDTLVLAIPPQAGPLPAVLDKPVGPEVNAWVCRGVNCLMPVASPDAAIVLLDDAGGDPAGKPGYLGNG
jgi:uncharacterized protein YyaL (SSP411 family)